MPARPTLLAHISPRLSTGEENLATEALCFVLNQSPATRRGFIDFLARTLGRSLPELSFRTQAGHEDGTIPDLVGTDMAGQPLVYVESKFWAGLTESQPVGYLRRLQREGGVGLVMVAPANRLGTLWPTLWQRCEQAGSVLRCHEDADHRRFESDDSPPLVLTSWSAVLQNLLHAATIGGDISASEDLRQIEGLCSNMEDAGFLPLRPEELTGNVARRILDYCGLVDDLTATLVSEGLARRDGLQASGGSGYYGRWIRLKGNGTRVSWDARHWAKVHASPLWLTVFGPTFKGSADVRHALAPLLAADSPRAFADVEAGILVPLHIPTASERHIVMASLAEQVRSVYALIPAASGGTPSSADAVSGANSE